MSYILDALKKSERERTLARGVGYGDAGRRLSQNPGGLWWSIAAVATVAAVVIAVVMVALGNRATAPTSESLLSASGISGIPAGPNTGIQPTTDTRASSTSVSPMVPFVARIGDASFLSDMPADFQRRLPQMTVTIHVYAPEESQRMLYIDNHQYRRGDEIPGGVFVEAIVADGVVLQFHNQRFKLPRPR